MQVKFKEHTLIGEGGFGKAYKVRLRKATVAIKVMKVRASPGTPEYENLTQEAKLLVTLDHKNIIKLYSYGCKNRKVFYIMEYADGGSIWDALKESGPLPFEKYIAYSIDICSGLQYLHTRQPPVEHRDLKPENVLLSDGRAKICDFGISIAREVVSATTAFKGTFNYAPPEYFDDSKGYGPKSDMYSFGLTVWAMISGERPYNENTYGQIVSSLMKKSLPEIPSSCPSSLDSVLKRCWDSDPHNRPTSGDLVIILDRIQRNPKEAVGSTPRTIKDFSSAELADYLRQRNVIPDFIVAVKENLIDGSTFIQLTEDDLTHAPFNLPAFQAKFILRIIAERK